MANRVDYNVVNSWGTGLQANISLTPDQTLNGWTLEFDAGYDINQIWNAQIVSHVGTHYVVRNLDWNASVASGSPASLGFIAGPGSGPVSFMVNNLPVANAPPTPPVVELPTISVADLSIVEGDSGQSYATFTLTLSKMSATPVTLDFATQDGTAKGGLDYLAASGSVTFAAGETRKTVQVAVLGDKDVEPNEAFSLALSKVSGAILPKANAVATILNDDAAPVVLPSASVADVSTSEGNTGQKLATFTVTLSSAASGPVSLAYTTRDGTAVAGSDYVATSGTITFAAGETSKTISVALLGDQVVEPDETFTLALSNATGATITRGVATGTIQNDDVAVPPTAPSSGAMVTYAASNDWGTGFTADVKVTAGTSVLNGWMIEFDAPFTITNIWNADLVSHSGDHYIIRNASWSGTVAATSSVSFGFQASTLGGHDVSHLTINGASAPATSPTPVPALPTISAADVSVTEGHDSTANFTVSLSKASDTPVTVHFDTVNGTAVAGSDFTARSGTLTFNPGETSRTVQVAVLGDTTAEPTETFSLKLSAASGATLARDTAIGTILDDDTVAAPPAQSHAGYYHTKGNQIVDDAGNTVKIAGVNWFGFETSTFAPHGLNARGYTAMMDQMKLLGFNTIRLPFSDQLFDTGRNTPTSIDYNKNPDLRGLSGLDLMDKIINYAGSIGLKVILDHHRSSSGDGPNDSGLWYDQTYGETTWINNWKMLAQHYAGNTAVIGADLANEPHGAATWGDGSANDWAAAATRAGNAIQSVNSDWLVIVEGTGQNYWWGGDLSGVASHPVTLNKPGHVVYSTHDYPNSVYPQPWFSGSAFPNNLEQVFDQHWGYVYRQNIAPVFVGEFGTKMTDPKDLQWLTKLTAYLGGDFNADGTSDIAAGQQGISWSWWSWNPDSGDTGGILNDDWTTVNQNKVDALRMVMADNSPLTGSH
ncbi:Calx-beta domain-containing protein [Paracraurococcus lichenis]|uniref:cellulase n=1 Tax=Paracraurococcus lichenis TaxID=3064888 RepID=A0ABT9EC14_9PROT|nr:Calx-beta domain-containing protein [Paracraurococcus sp. LOR1-02]MDO9713754.1 cellulase family glycosylhydrolase [Paracraurococcus sp. LOR1-02]